jgi:hypothetical protein
MIRQTRALLRGAQQLAKEVTLWNKNYPDAPAMSDDRPRALVSLLKSHLAELEKRPAPGKLDGKYIERILELD